METTGIDCVFHGGDLTPKRVSVRPERIAALVLETAPAATVRSCWNVPSAAGLVRYDIANRELQIADFR
jgi:hypothetical protein